MHVIILKFVQHINYTGYQSIIGFKSNKVIYGNV